MSNTANDLVQMFNEWPDPLSLLARLEHFSAGGYGDVNAACREAKSEIVRLANAIRLARIHLADDWPTPEEKWPADVRCRRALAILSDALRTA